MKRHASSGSKKTTIHWNGLTLMAVDGTLWRTPDAPENDAALGRTDNEHAHSDWP
ncbi:hypothetical protein HN028_14835 [Pantoea ananatis]